MNWRLEIWTIEPKSRHPDMREPYYEVWLRESEASERRIAQCGTLAEAYDICNAHGVERAKFRETPSGKYLATGVPRVVARTRHSWKGPLK